MPQPRRTDPDRPKRNVKFDVSIDGVVPTHEELRRRHPDVVDLLPGAADQDRASFDTPEEAQRFADALERSEEVIEVTYPHGVDLPSPNDVVSISMTEAQARQYEKTLPSTQYLAGPVVFSENDDPTYIIGVRL